MPEVELTYGGAINAALTRVLRDPKALLYGEDVAKPGGVFGVSRGLRREYGDRVFDTPISESAILGSALGAAMMGMRPIVEIMWADFALVAFDQIANQIANARYLSRGEVCAAIVIRTQQGTAPGACAQHSQNLESLFLHIPGVRVVMPSTAQDAYDAVVTAYACDDPVVVIENRSLYAGEKQSVTVDGPVAPIGGSRLRRAGDGVTVVSWGSTTRKAEQAADIAVTRGVTADVIETHWLNPFDTGSVLESVRKTKRLLVVHEANLSGGWGGEVLARISEAGVAFDFPPVRIGLPDVRVPAAPILANAVVPSREEVVDALVKIAGA